MSTRKKHTAPRVERTGPKRVVPYIRVSRIGGRKGDSYISKPEQLRTIAQLCDERGYVMLPALEDEDKSGGNLDRPNFQACLDMIRRGEADAIGVKTLDRFSRDTIDGLTTLEEIELELGGELLCGDGAVSVATPDAKIMATLRFGMADRELGVKTEGWQTSTRNAIERGVHLGIPYGYRRDPSGKTKKLVKEPTEARTVKRVFNLRAAGWGWSAIAVMLNEEGVQPRPVKRSGKKVQGKWTHNAIRKMVKNEVYLGVAFNGLHRKTGAHVALVTRPVWNAANKTVGTRHAGPDEGYLLTGLVRCAECGYSMRHTLQKGRRYYVCTSRTQGARSTCTAPVSVPAQQLEDLMDERFALEVAAIHDLEAVIDDAAVARAEAAVADAEAAVAEAMQERTRLAGASKTAQRMAGQEVDRVLAELDAAETTLERERIAARGIDLPTGIDTDAFLTMPVDEKRHLLSLVFAGVCVRTAAVWRESIDERVWVVLRDEAPDTDLIPFFAALDW